MDAKWYVVDVKGKVLGRIATEIADLLRGKKKTFFTPQHDCGDYVVAINAKEVVLKGNKLDKKMYFTHSGYRGGGKHQSARLVLEKHPERLLYLAVFGMLPKNRLRKKMIGKLKIFTGPEHTHQGQNPELIEL